MLDLTPQKDKVILVGVGLKSEGTLDTSMDELTQLCESAGGEVVGLMTQRLERITPATYIGSGKVDGIRALKEETGANLIVIDTKLSGVQARNLQEIIGCKVIDRHQLII